jgi:hypothetical protein
MADCSLVHRTGRKVSTLLDQVQMLALPSPLPPGSVGY